MKRNISRFWLGFEIDVKGCIIARVTRLFFFLRLGKLELVLYGIYETVISRTGS
jgi:hypothetical protein